jgi:hypothetical protein
MPVRAEILPHFPNSPHAMTHASGVRFAGIGPAIYPVSRVSRVRLRLSGVGGAWACRVRFLCFPGWLRPLILGFYAASVTRGGNAWVGVELLLGNV